MQHFILADNQFATREGVRSTLARLGYRKGVAEVGSRSELKAQLLAAPNAVVVVDYTLFDLSEPQLINMKTRHAQAVWVLFSDELTRHFLLQVMLSELRFSVVMKTDSRCEIEDALVCAVRGDTYVCEAVAQLLAEDMPPSSGVVKLTQAEVWVLHEVAMGKTTKEIAYERNLSFHTINTHRKNIFRKLEINNVHDAVKYALRAGIIDVSEYVI
ncbi:MAG: response regulator transcription factor [Prevotellaceae bacterium]|jgi:DNA-binding NarL/FixJ family response regulator|nr:response regulator transcription factor [Prevotellaceae bacterium]